MMSNMDADSCVNAVMQLFAWRGKLSINFSINGTNFAAVEQNFAVKLNS